MRAFIEKHMSLTFAGFWILGLLIPGIEAIPAQSMMVLLGIVIFLTGFKIQFNEITHIHFSRFFLFYALRFIALPIGLYYAMVQFSPVLALGLLLFGLLPPAASSPTMSHIFKGNVSLSFALLILGSFLSPLLIPLIIFFVNQDAIPLDIYGILQSLVLTIVLPMCLYSIVRKHVPLQNWVKTNGSATSLLLIGMMFTISISKHKEIILGSPMSLLLPILVMTGCVLLFYSWGWLFSTRSTQTNKVSYVLGSGSNNVSLGISIALLYFPAEVSLFLLMSQIPWIFSLTPFKKWAKRIGTQV